MSVQAKTDTKETTLILNNTDKENLERCFSEWKFKDYQSLMRFVSSILIESEDKITIGIKKSGVLKEFSPADHLLKDS